MNYEDFALRAQQRARDERHQARWRDGLLTVLSDTTPGEVYEQHFEVLDTGALWMHCTCPSGVNRAQLLVPCKHVTRWGDRMVRELSGAVKFSAGIYWLGESDSSLRNIAMSRSFAEYTCATRLLSELRTAAETRDLTPQERKKWDRLSELLSRVR